MTVKEIQDTTTFTAVDKLLITRGLEKIKSFSIVDTSDIDRLIKKVINM